VIGTGRDAGTLILVKKCHSTRKLPAPSTPHRIRTKNTLTKQDRRRGRGVAHGITEPLRLDVAGKPLSLSLQNRQALAASLPAARNSRSLL
jgi:hypothetical protein